MKAHCEACIYWEYDGISGRTADTSGQGWCRRNPPVVVTPKEGWDTVWPLTFDSDWCGEFKMVKK